MHIDYSVPISLQVEKKNTKFAFEQKNILLLNEDILMVLKFKKKFHKYLSTCMLHSKLRKKRG